MVGRFASTTTQHTRTPSTHPLQPPTHYIKTMVTGYDNIELTEAEIAYIEGRLKDPEIQKATGLSGDAAYSVFLDTIPYNFYPMLMLLFALLIVYPPNDVAASVAPLSSIFSKSLLPAPAVSTVAPSTASDIVT